VLVAQISDLHVAEPGSFMREFVDANAGLERAVAYLNGLTRPPDVVIATGDLTDHGLPAEYALLRELLAPLRSPVHLIRGNHDERGPFRDAFGDGPDQYAVDDAGPVRLVAFDSVRGGHHDGIVEPGRLAWLDATLADRPDTPTLVFLHHVPFTTGIWWMDSIGLTGAADLEAVVRRHPQVRLVAAGHLHRPITTTWGTTIVSVAPSTAHQTRCDLDPDHRPVIAAEPPMLSLHWWTGDAFVSHCTPFDRQEAVIDMAALMSDWESARVRIAQGPPFAKGGAFG
jgi:3',5'-cyclic AMP phosphodiesterase CpdA